MRCVRVSGEQDIGSVTLGHEVEGLTNTPDRVAAIMGLAGAQGHGLKRRH
jgi:hypothetical protein